MDRISQETPDLTQENIAKIAALFPDVVTETKDADGNVALAVDFDALRDDLSGEVVDGPRERYQFTWPGKREAKLEARRPIKKTMRPCPEKSKDWDTTENLYIEGDNLEALKIMRETYAGKVKLIYIDPPYNTGHDFVYDDDFSQTRAEYDAQSGDYNEEGGRLVANPESNGRFHSDWCSMMYPRLMLARDMLSVDGVIAISIDDNEQINMRKLCNEVFGESSFIAQAIWQKRTSPDMRKRFSTAHEYVLFYVRNSDHLKDAIGLLPLSEEDKKNYKNPDNDPRGPWVSSDYTAQGFRPNQMYAIKTPAGKIYTPPEGTCWKNVESEYLQQASEGRFWYGADGSGMPRRKTYLSERTGKNTWTWWSNKEVGHTQEATKELKSLFIGEPAVFDFPKPTRLIERLISICTDDTSIVLDFFSGSATSADAVMRKNAEDGGNRRFILVQLPEETSGDWENLCNVGEERIRRAGEKIKAEIDKGNEQLECGADPRPVPDIGFRVLRVDDSCLKDEFAAPDQYDQTQLDLFADNAAEGAVPFDLLFQVLPAFRIEYSAKITERELGGKTCFDVNDGQLIACFDKNVDTAALEAIAKERPLYAVFRDACFSSDAAVANLEELFKTFSPDTIRKVI